MSDEQIAEPSAPGEEHIKAVPPLRGNRLKSFAVAALIVVPLAATILLYGHTNWTCQWAEVAVAFGWSAPRYPWVVEPAPPPDTASSELLQRLFVGPAGTDADRIARVHGAWLVVREQWEYQGADPVGLIIQSKLGTDARWLRAASRDVANFAPRMHTALSELPPELILEADLVALGSQDVFQIGNAVRKSMRETSRTRISDADRSPDVPAAALWRLLLEANRVIVEHATSEPPYFYVHHFSWGNSPALWVVSNLPGAGRPGSEPGPLLDQAGATAYAEALKRLAEARPEKYLETELETRAQRAWEILRLQPALARYTARSDGGVASTVVGWHCAQHLELLEKLAGQAISDQKLDEAARWIELQEKVALVLKESVRSPSVFNYVDRKLGSAAALAQVVQTTTDCPAEVAERMAAVVARSVPITPQVTTRPIRWIAAAFYSESVARGCLRIAAITLAAALAGWLHLRTRTSQTVHRPADAARPRGTWLVAIAAFVCVVVAFAGLEASNLLGPHTAPFCYAVALAAILLAIVARFAWLAVVELVRDEDEQRQRLRRRMFWLIACFALLAAMRPLVGSVTSGGNLASSLTGLERITEHTGLPAVVALFCAAFLLVVMIAYAALRWRRWRREPSVRPVLHPMFVAAVSVWLSLLIVFDSPGEWLRGRQPPATGFGGDFTPVMDATGVAWTLLYGSAIAGPPRGLDWNLLVMMVVVAIRTLNLGLWLVLASVVLWRMILARPALVARPAQSGQTIQEKRTNGPLWLRGVVWSCLWVGLAGLVVHAWCTLAFGYSMSRVIASV